MQDLRGVCEHLPIVLRWPEGKSLSMDFTKGRAPIAHGRWISCPESAKPSNTFPESMACICMYKATAGWRWLDTLVHDALPTMVVSSYYILLHNSGCFETPRKSIKVRWYTKTSPTVRAFQKEPQQTLRQVLPTAPWTSPGQVQVWSYGSYPCVFAHYLFGDHHHLQYGWKMLENQTELKHVEKYWSQQPECLWTLFRLLRLVMLQIFGHPGSSSLTSLLTSDWDAPSSHIYWAFEPGIQTCQSKLPADNFVHNWTEHLSKPC